MVVWIQSYFCLDLFHCHIRFISPLFISINGSVYYEIPQVLTWGTRYFSGIMISSTWKVSLFHVPTRSLIRQSPPIFFLMRLWAFLCIDPENMREKPGSVQNLLQLLLGEYIQDHSCHVNHGIQSSHDFPGCHLHSDNCQKLMVIWMKLEQPGWLAAQYQNFKRKRLRHLITLLSGFSIVASQ